VCGACQQAKSHPLSFSDSTRVTTKPLELVHSDVWGPIIKFVNGYQYYVSFLDDYSHFTWIYLIKDKSDVESIFLEFQKRVELLLNTKIKSFQSDGGGEYHKLHHYFRKMALSI
jgi:hypothetical protein